MSPGAVSMCGSTVPRGLKSYRIEPLGECHVLMTFTDDLAEDRWRHAHSICRALERLAYDAVISTFAAYDTLLVEFDALCIDSAGMALVLGELARGYSAEDEAWLGHTARYRMPVVFGQDVAPIAEELGLRVAELVELQTAAPIRIRCRAVGGGLMMLNHDSIPPVSRLSSPEIRETVGGEFNVAGRQCSIGLSIGRGTTGWRTIGRTPVDVRTEFLRPSSTYNVGDQVLLEPIDADSWDEFAGRPVELAGAPS